jgi:hypothetical protein
LHTVGVAPEHAGAHANVPLFCAQSGVDPVHFTPHAPQLCAVVVFVSQPSSAFAVQCA